jgi:outer membrane protein OmpA-like peptidoglycan-associated protein
MRRFLVAFAVVFSAFTTLLALPARAYGPDTPKPDDVEGAKDHPLFTRFPASAINEYEQKDFDEEEIAISQEAESGELKTRHVEGKVTRINYENGPKASLVEVIRNYQGAFAKAGFKVLFEKKLNADDRILTGELLKPRPIWVSVRASTVNDYTVTALHIVEGKAMEQRIEADAAGMLEELNKSGHVAVYGITFATGKATLAPGSMQVLAEVAKLLAANPGLKLRIEGHTDNAGKAKDNLALSKKRAASVKDWLMKAQGVKGANLTTEGFGDAKPVEGNDTEEGRAKNRRVELVKL